MIVYIIEIQKSQIAHILFHEIDDSKPDCTLTFILEGTVYSIENQQKG